MSKKNNKGFTLIEVIVSIAILAIITAPLLNAFVIAGKNNAAAQIRQNATNYSESMMEKFKAQSYESITSEFVKIDTAVLDDYVGQNYYYTSGGKDIFNINGEKLTGNADSRYRAVVKVESKSYAAPELADIDSKSAAIIIGEVYKNDDAAIQEIESIIYSKDDSVKKSDYKSTNTPEDVKDEIQTNTVRTIHVLVEDSGQSGLRYSVKTLVRYECEYATSGERASVEYTSTEVYYEKMPDIMLFYTMYKYGTDVAVNNDKIVVNNSWDEMCRVYIANQTVGMVNYKTLQYTGATIDNPLTNISFQSGGVNKPAHVVNVNGIPSHYETDNIEGYMSNGISASDTSVDDLSMLMGNEETVDMYDITVEVYCDNVLQATVTSTKKADD